MLEIENVTNELFLRQVHFVHDLNCQSIYDVYLHLDQRRRANFDKFVNIYMLKAGCSLNDESLKRACIELALKYYFL